VRGTLWLAPMAALALMCSARLSAQSPPAPAKITLIQHVPKDAGTATTTSVPLPIPNTVGDFIAVLVRAGGSLSEAFTIRDTSGNTYQKAAQTVQTADNDSLAIYFAENIKGGANTVLISDNVLATLRVDVLEYSGVKYPGSLDVTAMNQGKGTGIFAGPITTTATGDLTLGFGITANPATFSVVTPWKIEDTVPAEPGSKLVIADHVQAGAGAISFSSSLSASDNWSAVVASFKPGTTAPPKETGLIATPAIISLNAAGTSQQLQLEATYSNESSENVTAFATYASNNTSVAKVSQSGLVTAIAKGNATIAASYGGMASSVSVAVSIPVATYTISGSTAIASAKVTLSGTSSAVTTASTNGAYSFVGVTPGSYTITPSLGGYTFAPASHSTSITNANVAGINFTATGASHLVDLTWGAGTIKNPAPGQVVVGYDVYRSSVSGGPYTKLNATLVAGLTYTDTAVLTGQTLYYVCASVDNMGDISPYSTQTTVTVP
jgi:hypothetical protein